MHTKVLQKKKIEALYCIYFVYHLQDSWEILKVAKNEKVELHCKTLLLIERCVKEKNSDSTESLSTL